MKFYSGGVSSALPRNNKQVQNVKHRLTGNGRLSSDALINLHDIAFDLPDFVWNIQTYPDLIVVCGRLEVLAELERLLLITTATNTQLLSYDTTFQFGDFYVSSLLFRAICFQQSPVIPAIFMIHERKLRSTHQTLCSVLANKVPELLKTSVVLVTDREKSFDVFHETFQNITHLHCWNHLFTDVKHWVRKHAGHSHDVTVYVQDVRELVQSRSEAEYVLLLADKSRKWSASFAQYFDSEIHPHVNSKLGRWVLERMRIYNPYSGITQNMSEGFNTVLRRLQEWKEAPLDMCILSMFYLQGYYLNEWKRGLCGKGGYTLLGM